MNPENIVGRTITNVFETEVSIKQAGLPGTGSYFNIVIELDQEDLYELGAHKIEVWTKTEKLKPFENPSWAEQNNYVVIGQRIAKVIDRDSEEFFDGSLTLVLENNLIIEHQTSNGDQLFIDKLDEDE